MPAPTSPLSGDALLGAVTDAIVALHERYHHRAPVTAKTQMLDGDLLACVLGGVHRRREDDVELLRTTIVPESRRRLPRRHAYKFIDAVERLSGRDVLAFISNPRSALTWRSSCSCPHRSNTTVAAIDD